MKVKIYDTVYEQLKADRRCRNSDKYLIWRIWSKQGLVRTFSGGDEMLSLNDFLGNCASPESIRRCRQKIQEEERERIMQGTLHPDNSVLADDAVKEMRQYIARERGTHVYREQMEIVDRDKYNDRT